MKHIATIVGARPQFIKAAAVSRALAELPDITETLVHSGQHFDDNMSAVFFEELKIPAPRYHLNIQAPRHGAMTGRMLEKIEEVLIAESPDMVLVYGDTNTTLAGALAASKLHIPIAHVEAGLRSRNRAMPEEINRILTDHVSSLLFCPTRQAVRNLADEGIRNHVMHCGDVMYDAALMAADLTDPSFLSTHGLQSGQYSLATLHRAENTDTRERLGAILTALDILARTAPVVLPLHPRTRKKIEEFGLQDRMDSLRVMDPVSFLEMVCLEKHAMRILTDSGGVQKEAYFHKVPCITLREETEWTETLAAGWNTLAGADVTRILAAAQAACPGSPIDEYGTGTASRIIAASLRAWG